jgi:hypothetical protein
MARIVFTASIEGENAEQIIRMYDAERLSERIGLFLANVLTDDNLMRATYERWHPTKGNAIVISVQE